MGSNGYLQMAVSGQPRFEYAATATSQTNYIRNSSATGCKLGIIGAGGALPNLWAVRLQAGTTASVVSMGIEDNLPIVDVRFTGMITAGTLSLYFEQGGINGVATVQSQSMVFALNTQLVAGSFSTCATDPSLVIDEVSGIGNVLVSAIQTTGPITRNSLVEQRATFTYSITAGSTYFAVPSILFYPAPNIPFDFTIRVAAPQFEKALQASAWISTTTAAVTVNSRLPLGLLLEPQRANVVINSSYFSSYATAGSPGLVAASGIAPDGTNTAWLMTTSGANPGFYNGFPTTNGSIYTTSVYLKYVSGNSIVNFGANGIGCANFDLVTLTVSSLGPNTLYANLYDAGNGWYRAVVVFTANTANSNTNLYSATSPTTVFLAWGVQAELGTFATSFIYTNGSSVTRAADVWQIPSAARTNYVKNSAFVGTANFGATTIPTGWHQGSTCGITLGSREFGIENGIPFVDITVAGTSTLGYIDLTFDVTIPALTGQTWAISQYVRLLSGSSGSLFGLQTLNYETNSTASGGNILAGAVGGYFMPTNASLDMQRHSTLYTTTGGSTTALLQTGVRVVFNAGTVNCVLRIGGAQAELNTFATDFISTSGAAVTQVGWASTPGTWAMEYDYPTGATGGTSVIGGFSGSTGAFNNLNYWVIDGNGYLTFTNLTAGVGTGAGASSVKKLLNKSVISFDQASMQCAHNGILYGAASLPNGLPTGIVKLVVGTDPWGLGSSQPGFHVRSTRFWPYRKYGNALLALSL
jgi:hypothetical protein